MSRQRKRVATRVGMLAALVGMIGCGTAPSGPSSAPSRLNLSQCQVGSITWARCGTLSVLENPARPAGRHISLRVVVIPAYGSNRAPDPLFYFQGGPGGAAADAANVEWAFHTFSALNARRDLVFVDQRGTGGSNVMECPALMTAGLTSSGSAPSATDEAAAAKACLALTAASGDPTMYTTPLFADDVDQVRAALGYRLIDVYGASYGVTSALEYIQRHGEHVRTALLDSGSLLDVQLWQDMAAPLQVSLQSVLDRCAADASCRAANPYLGEELATIINRVAAAPVTVHVVDPTTGATVSGTINVQTLAAALSSQLDNVQDMARLPAMIFTAYLGEWPLLVQQALASEQRDNPQDTYVMARTIECSDAWARTDPAAARAAGGSSIFTQYVVNDATARQEFCAAWPRAAGASGPVRSNAPIVFLNGTADYTDPPANVAGARATMPNGLLVAVPGYGHGQLEQDTSGCLAREATTFIDKGVPSEMGDWPCAQHPPYPPFNVG